MNPVLKMHQVNNRVQQIVSGKSAEKIVMFLAYEVLKLDQQAIANFYNRDRTTINYHIKEFRESMEVYPDHVTIIANLTPAIEQLAA